MPGDKRTYAFNGTLKICPSNPRYFTDNSGKAVYLTGAHTWESLQDSVLPGKPAFNYGEYLNFMQKYNCNFMRMWIWEHANGMPGSEEEPLPYARTGPGTALDGKPKFDLDQWNEKFFSRLRSRVIEAGNKGIYVSIMLFQGFSIKKPWVPGDPWKAHPFHAENNINSVNGDNDADELADIHSLEIPAVVSCQQAFVKKVVDTVNDLENVLYEIINEPSNETRTADWHRHMIDFIHQYEAAKPAQHPVGMTATGHTQNNRLLLESNADWISPGQGDSAEYKYNPPASDGKKVVISDTDHLWGLGGDYTWVWKSFLRGLNPILMDFCFPQYCPGDLKIYIDRPQWEPMRHSLGYTREFAMRVDLSKMKPHNELAASTYCLANPEKEYLVYVPGDRVAMVVLTAAKGEMHVEWFNPGSGETVKGGKTLGGKVQTFTNPFEGDAVLYLFI